MRILQAEDCDDTIYIINKGHNYILYEPPNDIDYEYGCSINGCLDLDREDAYKLFMQLMKIFSSTVPATWVLEQDFEEEG